MVDRLIVHDFLVWSEGYETGIKEVVDWMFTPCPHAPKHFSSDKRMCVQCCEAKLKEWGIDSGIHL